MNRAIKHVLALVALCLTLVGCATGPTANPRDPLEPFNRGVFGFNDAVDRTVLKPVATAYRQVTPQPVRAGVGNFFANLEDVWSAVNSVLQLKAQGTVDNVMRVGVNTIFGLAGVMDLASEMGIERHPEDFGKTLGHWGVGAGPYVVLPFLGNFTLRDAMALPVDFRGDVVSNMDNAANRNILKTVNLIDARASFLNATSVIEAAALDKYSFTRDAYLQLRRNAVYNGNPPDEDEPPVTPPVK
jgi:phospholipid-binding lipoprotein MlaA